MRSFFLFVLLSCAFIRVQARAASESELYAERQRIDTAAAPHSDEQNQWTVVKFFNVKPSNVTTLRRERPSWSEVCLRLVIAQQIMKDDSFAAPTMDDALKVEDTIDLQSNYWLESVEALRVDLSRVLSTLSDARVAFNKTDSISHAPNAASARKHPLKTRERPSKDGADVSPAKTPADRNLSDNTRPRSDPLTHPAALAGRGLPSSK